MELVIIQNKIYELRGYKVMLDFDLAEIYQVETKSLNLSVKRNIKRFLSDFMFQLTREEWESLRFQIETSKRGDWRYLPYAFTELGATMLSAVRQLLLNPPVDKVSELQNAMKELKQYIEGIFTDYNDINEDTCMQLELINERKKIPLC